MPMGFPVEAFASALAAPLRAGDIVVSTYPKCGTTWVQHVVWLLLHEGEPLPPGRSLTVDFPHLEEVGAEGIGSLPEPRCIKTHLPFAMTPWHPGARYVVVARNPFDCAVSFFHHTRGFARHYDFADGTFSEFFECFVAGEVDFGDYFDHLESWIANRDEPNVLFLTYEAMKRDAEGEIAALGRFLGGTAQASVERPETLSRVLEHSSFDAMRRDQERWASRRPDEMPPFIRKGVVGDWKSSFTPEQAARLVERFDQRTGGTAAATLWPDLVAEAREFGRPRA